MIIGIPKEIKNNEFRVGILPVGVEMLTHKGHRVIIEKGAGKGSGISDEDFGKAGAGIVAKAEEIYSQAEMIVKIKEPLPEEYPMLRQGQVVITYFHFAASRELTEAMLQKKIVALAYETLQTEDGELPCLTPMSEVAGRMAVHEGAKYLEEPMKGRGILLGGVPGVAPAEVVIIGAGVVGANAARMAAGLGANVTVLDINMNRLRYLEEIMPPNVHTLVSNAHTIRDSVLTADLVISSVLKRGSKSPCLVDRKTVSQMKSGAVIVDVAIDQGGSFETSRPTTHENPTYEVDGVVHYCVTNMPGAVARTSTYALTNATLPYILLLSEMGWRKGVKEVHALNTALNMVEGKLTIREVAETFNLPYHQYTSEG